MGHSIVLITRDMFVSTDGELSRRFIELTK